MTLRLSLLEIRRTLRRPAQNAHSSWLERTATVLTIESDNGLRGSGEAAPLPGFSPDSLEACRNALEALNASDLPERIEPEQSLLAALERASQPLIHVPAARAALEGALLDLWSRAAGAPAWALLRAPGEAPRPRRVAALLMDEPEAALEQAKQARARGVTAFKLKVGRAGASEREVEACANLRAALGATADLRLDANGAWPAPVASENLRLFAPFFPEFVEEPCAFANLAALAPSPVPFALDESLLRLHPEPSALAPLAAAGLRALILKPTLLGGISACCAWARAARQSGLEVVLSHAFEGPRGLALAATLALTIGSETAAHGLDLEGACLAHSSLPQFAGARICAWSAPGFGELEGEA